MYLERLLYSRAQLAAEKPADEAASAETSSAPALLAAGLPAMGGREPEMVGPARLAESLLEASGASKPRSASLGVEGTAGARVERRSTREGVAGAAGRTRTAGERRRVLAGDDTGPELEGLPREFVVESVAEADADEPASDTDDAEEAPDDEAGRSAEGTSEKLEGLTGAF